MTFIELQLAVLFMAFLSATVIMYMASFQQMRNEHQANLKLSMNAENIVTKMIWGSQGSKGIGIRSANSLQLISATQVRYTDTNGNTHEIRLNGQNIEYRLNGNVWIAIYDPNGSKNADPTTYSTNLTFTQTAPTALQIQLVVGQKTQRKWNYASLSTQVAYRN